MELLKQIILAESIKASQKELQYYVSIINKIYREWKKVKRRVNAVDLVMTSVNKISNINPESIKFFNSDTKTKLVIIVMRCLDIAPWKPVGSKERIYKKLYPILSVIENENTHTDNNSILRDVILTRLSAAISYAESKGDVFVAYESKVPTKYLRYLFGEIKPQKVFRMASLTLPPDFDTLINILEINHQKAVSKLN